MKKCNLENPISIASQRQGRYDTLLCFEEIHYKNTILSPTIGEYLTPMKFGDLSTIIKVAGLGVVVVFLLLVFSDREGPGPEPLTESWAVVDEEKDSLVVQGDLALIAEEATGSTTLDDLAKQVKNAGPMAKGLAAVAPVGKSLRLNAGTRVMVVEMDGGAALVRVVDGPATGSECWIERQALKKMDHIPGAASPRVKVPVIVKGGLG